MTRGVAGGWRNRWKELAERSGNRAICFGSTAFARRSPPEIAWILQS
jgi:hypothetical protein